MPDSLRPEPEPEPRPAVAFEPTALGRRRRRLDPGLLIVGLAVILVIAAVARPWTGSGPAPSPRPAASAAGLLGERTARPSPSASRRLPTPSPTVPTPDPTRLENVIQELTAYRGQWGIGAGATPTSAVRPPVDWIAWVKVDPISVADMPSASPDLLRGLASIEPCSGLPNLPSGAQLIVITIPRHPLGTIGIRGWRMVGGGVDPPDVQELSGQWEATFWGSGDFTYLQRHDGQPWADGRYEFLIAGATGTTLTVCLGAA